MQFLAEKKNLNLKANFDGHNYNILLYTIATEYEFMYKCYCDIYK